MSFAPPASVSAIDFAGPQQVNPQSWESPRTIYYVVKRISHFDSHCASSAHSLFLCLFSSILWFLSTDEHTHAHTWLMEVHGNGESLHCMPLPRLAYLGWTTATGDIYNQCVFIDRNRQSLPPLPNCCTTACTCSFPLQLGTQTKVRVSLAILYFPHAVVSCGRDRFVVLIPDKRSLFYLSINTWLLLGIQKEYIHNHHVVYLRTDSCRCSLLRWLTIAICSST